MSSRSAAKRIARPASKPLTKSAPKKAKAKLAKVTKFPTASVKKPLPAAKKSSPPPPAKKPEPPPPRGMPALTPPKQVQEPKQSLARSFYWSELRVGDDLPPLTKPAIDRVQIVRYAASSGDFNRLHLDEPYAHAVGFDRFGNIMLDVEHAELTDSGFKLGHGVDVNGHRGVYATTFADVAPGEVLLYEDAYRTLALAVNRGSARELLGAERDDELRITAA